MTIQPISTSVIDLHVADGVLQVAEAEGADRGGDVDDEHQHDGLLAGEFHRFLRVDGGERDHGHDAGLVEQDADEEAAQVAVVAAPARRVCSTRCQAMRALAVRPARSLRNRNVGAAARAKTTAVMSITTGTNWSRGLAVLFGRS